MHLCIISPHLDDAVLSCGIRMQRALAAGGRVSVLNIFNAGTNADNRRREEIAATAVLGAESFFLDELDAPDRDARYQSEIELFHGDFAHIPAEVITRVATRIEGFLATQAVDAVIFPLAAGTHIDHRVAFATAEKIGHPQTFYYEDRPYILWPGMLQARLNQIRCRTDVPVVTPAQMQADLGRYHYLSHFVPPGDFRDQCLPRYFADLQLPTAYRYTGAADTLAATAEELEKIYESLACYTSQMPFIYPNREVFLRDSLAHEAARSGQSAYLERSWRLTAID